MLSLASYLYACRPPWWNPCPLVNYTYKPDARKLSIDLSIDLSIVSAVSRYLLSTDNYYYTRLPAISQHPVSLSRATVLPPKL